MAVKKTASKKSSKVKVDLDIDMPSRKTYKRTKKNLKKVSVGALILSAILLVAGAVGGYFGVKYLTRNDCFEIIGKDEITLTLDEKYLDEGVKVVAFGKDEANKVKVTTNLKKNTDGSYYAESEGTYYITYTVDNLKYGTVFKVQKVRLITFVEPTEPEEIENAGGNNE